MDSLPTWLHNLSPQATVLVVSIWGLRELFAFIRRLIQDLKGSQQAVLSPQLEVDLKLISKALEAVADHITEQTKLTQGFLFELQKLTIRVEELSDEVKELKASS